MEMATKGNISVASVSTPTEKSCETLRDFSEYCGYGSVAADYYKVKLEDFAGYEDVKEIFREKVVLPLKFPQLLQAKREPQSNILLYGPAGCGKTMLLRAAVGEAECPLINVHCYSIPVLDKQHQEEFMKAVFEYAGDHTPSLLVFEDIEVLFEQSVAKLEYFRQLKNCGNGISVLCSSLKPWCIDDTDKARSKLEILVYVGLPDKTTRKAVVTNSLTTQSLTDQDLEEIADKTKGFSVSDLICLSRDAMMEPVRTLQRSQYYRKVSGPCPNDPGVIADDLMTPCAGDLPDAIQTTWEEIPQDKILPPVVNRADVLLALERTMPSILDSDIKRYEDYTEKYTMYC